MNANIHCEVAGYYKLEAVKLDDDGNVVSRRMLADWFPNIITNSGLDMIGGEDSNYWEFCRVGSGNTAPAATDTTLASQIASTSTITNHAVATVIVSPAYGRHQITYRFAAGVATGNLQEVGIGPDASTALYSRALILDGGGSPTSITVLADEFLDVTYEHRLYVPETDVAGVIADSGIGGNYNYTIRASEIDATDDWADSLGPTSGFYSPTARLARNQNDTNISQVYDSTSALGPMTGSPSGVSDSLNTDTGSSVSSGPYVSGSYQRSGTLSISISDGNTSGGIGAVKLFTKIGRYQIGFSPAIPKTSARKLDLTFTFTWTRRTI